MFRKLNKIIHENSLKRALRSSDGQAAIVLILVIAVALIFYAVSLNLGQITTSKALVTIASNTSASLLASDMASYGQYLSETNLGGKKKVCDSSGVLASIVAIIVIVIVTIVTYGAGTSSAWTLTGALASLGSGLSAVGLALALVALAIQATVIVPGIVDAWNRITSKTLSISNQFTEGAIQTALGKAVTDPVLVPDVLDSDMDGVWVKPGEVDSRLLADEVSRFALYYSDRLRKINSGKIPLEIEAFITALKELLYEGGDGWGLHDPIPGIMCKGKAECHPCCVPDEAEVMTGDFDGTEEAGYIEGLRPQECSEEADDAEWELECGNATPYQLSGGGSDYPWMYDPYYENPDNEFFSFRELIGRDDEHRDYYKRPEDPNSEPEFVPGPGRLSQLKHDDDGTAHGFYMEDASGFYTPPVYTPDTTPAVELGAEKRKGIYPFFYKLRDWGVDLEGVWEAIDGGTLDPTSELCHWCWPNPADTDNDCPVCEDDLASPHPFPLEIPQLQLPVDPLDDDTRLIYNLSYVVDGINSPFELPLGTKLEPYPAIAVDRVVFPSNIIAADDDCADSSLYQVDDDNAGFWKPGGDRFCSTDPAYALACDKCNGDEACWCDPGRASQFPDDVIDNIVYGLPRFFVVAQALITRARDLEKFSKDFINWYEDVAEWIEPAYPGATQATDPPCYYCDKLTRGDGERLEEGYLWMWLSELTQIRDRIRGWVNNYNVASEEYEGYASTSCTQTWCIPQSNLNCAEIPPGEGEEAMIDSNANGIEGDIEDITQCLNFNVNGYDHIAGEAFKKCLANCGADCVVGTTLPQYHLDGLTRYEYPVGEPLVCGGSWVPGNIWHDAVRRNLSLAVNPPTIKEGNDFRYEKCAMTCTLENCHRLPRSMVPYRRDALFHPEVFGHADTGTIPPDAADGAWKDMTAFNDCLRHCNPETCKVGLRLPEVSSVDGSTYNYPVGAVDCSSWGSGNVWYDAVSNHRNTLSMTADPNQAEVAVMLECFEACSDPDADPTFACGKMLLELPSPPSGAWPGASVDCSNWFEGGGNPWYDDIATNVNALSGTNLEGYPSCDLYQSEKPGEIPDGWLYSARQSMIESKNQVAKFEKRRNFFKVDVDIDDDGTLDYSQGRLVEAQNILTILDGEDTNRDGILQWNEDIDRDGEIDTGIIPELEKFLYGPAADLIQKRIDYEPNDEEGLPFETIYGWRDEDELLDGGVGKRRGKWHIVRVEARIPSRCETRCGLTELGGSDPAWPRIKSYTKGALGSTLCYKLVNVQGVVKFRTTRWDEDGSTKYCAGRDPCPEDCGGQCDANSTKRYSSSLKFPNGVPLWKIRDNHPARPLLVAVDLDGVCNNEDVTIKKLPGSAVSTDIYDGAFMMHRYEKDNTNIERCWDRATELLATGVVDETCAQYYWHGGINHGMGVKFTRCKQPF